MSLDFKVPPNTISGTVYKTCKAIIAEYLNEVVVCPSTPKGWRKVVIGFSRRWNFYNTIRAIDGKHIAIRAPTHSGSFYYNYKGFHYLVLLAVVDSDHKFLYVDVGAHETI
uniref:DDE Tnp4 domain-containing protein n=1 Tax=Scylla olivacea TaxID=85551 RepID=A0A0P4WGS2_SCYOL